MPWPDQICDLRSQNRAMSIDPTSRQKIVVALFDCDCMKTPQSRAKIVQDLPADVQSKIVLGATAKQDVDEIVRVCLQFPEALETLLQRVRFFEGESTPRQRLDEVVNETFHPQPLDDLRSLIEESPTTSEQRLFPAQSDPAR